MTNSQDLIEAAKKAHPAFRFATAVAGVLAFVVLFLRFGVNPATLALGALVFFGLMVVFVVFARLSRLSDAALALPARTAMWSVLLLSVASLALLFSSTFFDYPLPIRSHLAGRSIPDPAGSSLDPAPLDRVRVALVIGNSAYAESPLDGPDKDIGLIANALRNVGFRVKTLPNAKKSEILDAWKEVETVATYGGVALLYYSGHGFRVDGEDAMLPVDWQLADDSNSAIKVSSLMRTISAFDGKFDGASGELILYSTAPGGMAVDLGSGMDVSPFAKAFASAVRETKGDIPEVFKRASSETKRLTDGEQTPWVAGSFVGTLSLSDRSSDRSLGIVRLIVFDASRP